MSDEEIVEYVKQMIIANLANYHLTREIASIMANTSQEYLLKHIKGVIGIFKKAQEILERNIKKK